jgi:hypothetical protein
VAPIAQRLIEEYLAVAKHGGDLAEVGPFPASEEQPGQHTEEELGARLGLSQHRAEVLSRDWHRR